MPGDGCPDSFRRSERRIARPAGGLLMPPAHKCPVANCQKSVSHDKLMCGQHWYLVTKPTRSKLWSAYADGAGQGTPEHIAAMLACVREVDELLAQTRQERMQRRAAAQ